MKTVLRFYKGGPGAVVGPAFWWTAEWMCGCKVAQRTGTAIPPDAYDGGAWAEEPWVGPRYIGGGRRTAILPLEFRE